jgi:hypothetical protein
VSYLLDTDVLSLLRRQERHPALVAWLQSVAPSALYLSTITLGEVERGIEQQRAVNADFALALARWLEHLLERFQHALLPVSAPIARRWGRLSYQVGHSGADLLIAATALEHGLTVVTRNVHHFAPRGVACRDPLASPPPQPDSGH